MTSTPTEMARKLGMASAHRRDDIEPRFIQRSEMADVSVACFRRGSGTIHTRTDCPKLTSDPAATPATPTTMRWHDLLVHPSRCSECVETPKPIDDFVRHRRRAVAAANAVHDLLIARVNGARDTSGLEAAAAKKVAALTKTQISDSNLAAIAARIRDTYREICEWTPRDTDPAACAVAALAAVHLAAVEADPTAEPGTPPQMPGMTEYLRWHPPVAVTQDWEAVSDEWLAEQPRPEPDSRAAKPILDRHATANPAATRLRLEVRDQWRGLLNRLVTYPGPATLCLIRTPNYSGNNRGLSGLVDEYLAGRSIGEIADGSLYVIDELVARWLWALRYANPEREQPLSSTFRIACLPIPEWLDERSLNTAAETLVSVAADKVTQRDWSGIAAAWEIALAVAAPVGVEL